MPRVASAAHSELLAEPGAYANPPGFAGTTVHKNKLCRTRFSEGDLVCVTTIYPPLLRQWIGFDKLANALQSTTEHQTFPPYNIEKSDDNHYRITLALAGFRQDDLDIQLEGTRLTVKGSPEKQETETKWLHQGLVTQPFSLSFTPADHMEVSGATFTNGLLHIDWSVTCRKPSRHSVSPLASGRR